VLSLNSREPFSFIAAKKDFLPLLVPAGRQVGNDETKKIYGRHTALDAGSVGDLI
jgi:hypothetical protein